MKKIPLIVTLSLLVCGSVYASELNPVPVLRVILSKQSAQLVAKNKTLKLNTICDCSHIDKLDIVSQAVRSKHYYIVLFMSGPSHEGNPMSYCGAGTEENLVWLKLDKQLRIQDSKKYLIASCNLSVEKGIDQKSPLTLNQQTKKMEGEFNSFSEMKQYSLSYDPAMPENGVSVIAKKMDEK
jgi:hypothetical protein